MTPGPSWEEQNNAYLHKAIAWLRLRLLRLINAAGAPHHAAAPPADLRERIGVVQAATPEQIAEAAEAIDRAAAEMDPPPALVTFARRFRLSDFEREVLLLCAAVELDTVIAGLCARAHDNPQQAYPTFALALALFDRPAWDVVSPIRPLRYCHILELSQYGHQPLTISPLRADERIVNYLKGLNYMDDRLTPLLSPIQYEGDEPLAPSQEAIARRVVSHLELYDPSRMPVVQLLGTDGSSKQLVAWHVARRMNRILYRLPAELVPVNLSDLDMFLRLWQRERVLLRPALYVDAHEVDPSSHAEGAAARLNRLLTRAGSIVFLDVPEAWPGVAEHSFSVDVARATSREQEAAWQEAFADFDSGLAARLAGTFSLPLPMIRLIAGTALAEPAADAPELAERVWDACLAATRPRLDALAQRLEPNVPWDDLVLPAAEKCLLEQIVGQVEQRRQVYEDWGFAARTSRGLGISALFAGESGTGKTMAAEALATRLQLNLYRIDLSGVMNQYIGVTEKNLRRLFDAAEDGGVILFFDEADALFGKRSEVKDSHDRYANIQINYLLQRMEAYRGLAILATNMKSALDPAFLRRLRFIVNFPFPAAAQRKEIWKKTFPAATPLAPEGLDYDWLARLGFTGGNITSIALNTAFLAAQRGEAVSMPRVLDAVRTEYGKIGKPFKEADLQWRPMAGMAR